MQFSDEDQSSVVESNEYSDSSDEEVFRITRGGYGQISIPEEEWVREEEELDQSIAAAGAIVNNSVALYFTGDDSD